jgi:hypothetical protein
MGDIREFANSPPKSPASTSVTAFPAIPLVLARFPWPNGPKNPAGFGSLTIGLERYRAASK